MMEADFKYLLRPIYKVIVIIGVCIIVYELSGPNSALIITKFYQNVCLYQEYK